MSRTRKITTSLAAAIGLLAILALPSVAAAKDRNHDRIPDRWEKRHHLSLQVNQAGRDQDSDGLRNRAEFMAGDNPRDADTDNDGIPDGEENAGKIASFDAETGKLTIDLFGGETLSGMVTEETEIKCEGSDSASASDSNEGEDNPGDEQGQEESQNEEEPGEDNSGPGSENSGPETGDDNGGEANCTIADLVPGAVVQEAELRAAGGTATFEEVELAG
jgi:hypothetical protein